MGVKTSLDASRPGDLESNVHYLQAMVFGLDGRGEDALAHYRSVRDLGAKDPVAFKNLGQVLDGLGCAADAREASSWQSGSRRTLPSRTSNSVGVSGALGGGPKLSPGSIGPSSWTPGSDFRWSRSPALNLGRSIG